MTTRTEVSGMDMIGNSGAAAPNGARTADGLFCLGRNGAVSARPADGHLKAMKPIATKPDGVNKPELNVWAARH